MKRQAKSSVVLALPVVFGTLLGTGARAEDSMSDLVATGAEVRKLVDGFVFTEGPACDANGDVFFTDIPNQRVHKWDVAGGKLTTFRENTGRANGLFFNARGQLIACEGGARSLTSTSPDGKTVVLVDQYKGKKFNSPNDLWIDPRGGVYFTDPRYGRGEPMEQDGMHVYYLKPDRKTVVRVVDNLEKPNGVVGTSDGKLLYVADPGGSKTYVYKIQKDGSLQDRKLIAESGSDGMTLDARGNLYLTAAGVVIYSPQGKKIGMIDVPESPSNVCFGGKDGKTLFVTARTGFYALAMQVAGQKPIRSQ